MNTRAQSKPGKLADRLAAHPLLIIKRHYRSCWWLVFAVCLMPSLNLAWESCNDSLGINKLERLSRSTGIWALNLLIVSLAVTPARRWFTWLMIYLRSGYGKRLSDWNFMVQMRRMIGVFSFYYATLHLMIYLWFDLGFDWRWLWPEIQEKPYLAAGMAAFVLLVPLALTSTNAAMRYFGKNWRRLHRSVYAISLCAALHYLWLSKAGIHDARYYLAVIMILLGDRLLLALGWLKRRPNDDGMEAPERNA